MSLQQYIDEKNRLRKLTNQPPLFIPNSQKSCRALYQMIGDDMTPEILSCHGERAPEQVQSAHDALVEVWQELDTIHDVLF